MAKQQPEEVMTLKRALTTRTQEDLLYEKLSDKTELPHKHFVTKMQGHR